MEFEIKALGTKWWIRIFQDLNKDLCKKIQYDIEKIIFGFDESYSRFKNDSYIYKLNETKELKDFPLELFYIFKYSEQVRELTDGAFNISFGTLVDSLGYDYKLSLKDNRKLIDMNELGVETLKSSYIKIKSQTSIDLGGIGKGWLIDKIKAYFDRNFIDYFSINGGGDIYVSSDNGEKVTYQLENPFDIKQSIGHIDIKNMALAASANNKRSWKIANEKYSHLLKSTDIPIEGVFTSSKKALSADLCSTCLFVSNPNQWENISKFFEAEYLVVFSDGNYLKSENYLGELNHE